MTIHTDAATSVARRAATGAGWIIAWRMVSRNIGLASTLILVRLLQPADFGLVALASGFISSVDALSAIGVQDALVRATSIDEELYNTGFGLGILRGAMTALLIAAIAWPVGVFFEDMRLAVVMLALAAGMLISAFENIGIVDFRRDLDFRKEFEMQLWSRVAGALTTVAVAALWRSYWALVAGILVFRVVRLIQSYILSHHRPSFGLSGWRRIIGFSMWTWAQTLMYQARERSDSIVVGRVLGTGQVGVFSVGLELGALPSTELVEPLGRALFSGFASVQNSTANVASMFVGAVALGLTLVLPAGLGISMIADPLVRFALGEKWIAAIPVVQIMAIGGTTSIFGQACTNLLNALGRPNTTFYIVTASTVVKLAALLVMVPRYGLVGASGALIIGILVDLVLLLGATLPRIGVSLLTLGGRMVRPLIATAAMVLLLWRLGLAWTPTSGSDTWGWAIDAMTRSAIGAAGYAIVLAAAWFVAGRPDGAERFALSMAARTWMRLFRRIAAANADP
jgi:lipopolysaccharide exporter